MWRLHFAFFSGVGLPICLWAILSNLFEHAENGLRNPLLAYCFGTSLPAILFTAMVGTAIESFAGKSYATVRNKFSGRPWRLFFLGVVTTVVTMSGGYGAAHLIWWLVVPLLPVAGKETALVGLVLTFVCAAVVAVLPLKVVSHFVREQGHLESARSA